MLALAINDLQKNYGHFCALDHVNLSIKQGEFFGLLGPNGAGKTTLIKTIVGLARRNGGSVTVFGHDVEKDYQTTRRLIGLSPQEPNVDRFFKVRRVMEFQGGYFGLKRKERRPRAEELIKKFGLDDKMDTQYWRLSGGMQKRVMVARSMMGAPKILILDEPTAGVDVEQRHELWKHLRGLNQDGTTIILTTHYIDEAEALCERVGVIHRGKIIACDTPQKLIEKHCEQYFEVKGQRQEQINGLGVNDIRVHRGSLEEVFLKLTGCSIHADERQVGAT
jgi:ABC-2 type transport system ATP-binding protein